MHSSNENLSARLLKVSKNKVEFQIHKLSEDP